MKVRQDAWSHEDDLLLAETVLRHIREGSTQLLAFDEVGDKHDALPIFCRSWLPLECDCSEQV